MQSIVRRDWLQITSNVAIIVGLMIVIYELKQTEHHVRAQLVMDDYNIDLSMLSDLMGEDPANAIAKAWHDPDRLTPEDEIVVEAYLNRRYLSLGVTVYFAEDLEIFAFWERVARSDAEALYKYPYARQWWRKYRQENSANLHPLLDSLIDGVVAEYERAESGAK